MKNKIRKITGSILSFALAASMVMGLSGMTALAAEGDEAAETQTIIVEENVVGTADTEFDYHIYQIMDADGKIESTTDISLSSSVPGADLPYTIYDSETKEALGEETTDEDGGFSLSADEYAEFTVLAETDWYVHQETPEEYPLTEATADGDHASIVGDIEDQDVYGVVQYESEEEPTPTSSVDKSALGEEIEKVEALDENDYTPESWEKLQEALEKAKEVFDNPDATQEEVNEALEDLKEAEEGLTKEDSEPEPTPEPDPDKVNITVTKTWDDNDNQDGKRPENITVNLLADGSEVKEAAMAAGADDSWTYTFEDMPVQNDDGKEITYTVTEDRVDGYDEPQITGDAEEGFVITNSCTPETVTITIEKAWEDSDNQDGVRPDSITVGIFAGKTYVDSKEITEADGWSCTFDDLPVYENGEEIQYVAYEFADEPYYTGTAEWTEDTCLFTNSYTPEETGVSVQKVWDDADDQDGLRPDSVSVNLLADGDVVDTAELSEDNDWSYDFTGLDKYADGEEIAYTVAEDEVAGYEAEDPVRIDGTNQFILVNKHEPALYNGDGNMTVKKVWDDEDDSEGVRPDHIQVTVKADGEVVRQEYVTEVEDWTCTFTDLPQYADGQEIEYTVEETLPASVPEDTYTSEITEADGAFTITNTHAPIINVSVTKVWDDNDNQDNARPDEVTVTLLKDEEETGQTLTLSEDNQWTDTFEGLSEFEDGQKITYTVSEEDVEGYEAAIEGDQTEGFTITNTHVTGTVDVSVEKTWVDNDNEDETRPDEVTVHLWNKDTETHLGSATLNEENDWQYTFDPQPKYANGEEISYEVTEEAVDGYDTDIAESKDEDGCPVFAITNTYAFGATIDITGTKVWNDEGDQDGLRPDHVTIELLADGTVVDSKNITPYTTLTFAAPSPIAAFLAAEDVNEWNFNFKDLPKYNEAGEKINYTFNELAVEGYESTVITGDMTNGFTITNTHTPATITVSGTKSWNDDDNRDGLRQSMVVVYLTIDGARVEDGTGNYESAVLTENDGWTYSFHNLDKCANGKAIDYGVEEAEVPGYEAAYTSETDADGSCTIDITNTHEPETVNYTVTKIWYDTEDQDGEQPTSVTVRLLANGDEVDYMNLTANEDWAGTFTDLPKYENGQEITYTVTEDPVADYTTTYSDPAFDMASGTYSVTIMNTHTPDEETLTINKVWADNGDQDGIRPDPEDFSVNVLHSDDDTDEVVATISGSDWTVAGDVWTATLDVDMYENGGQEIHYTIEEPAVPDGYEVNYGDADPLTIINTHTPETVDITVKKVWDDNDNQDGVQHEVVTVRLYANGTEVASDNIAAVDNWTYTFTGLPKYENGTEITYTVTEDAMSDYSHEDIDLEAVDGGYEATITNTHTPGLTSVSVTKAWVDGNDQDGLQPESVAVTLLADGAAVDTQDLSDGNDWTYTFTDLAEYQNGSKVSYTVEEEAVGGYTSEITGDATAGYTITNYHTPETVDITGVKVWEDNDDQDGIRPASITVTLYADGAPVTVQGVSLTAVVDDEYGWHFAFTDLPKYDGKDGDEPHEIAYTLDEGGVPAEYDSTVTGSVSEGFTITNTYETDTTVISGTKTWEDNNNQDGERPGSITVHLYANGEEIDSQELTEADAIDDNTWEYTFGEDDPLPTYKNGEKIIYTVFEDEVDDYVTTYDGYDITNTHEAGLTSVTVMKLWEDNDDQDGIRPGHITVELYADGTDTGTACVLNKENEWTYTFEDLPVFDNGSRIQYAIAEIDEIDGYKVETVSVGTPADENYYYDYVIVNEHTPATTDVEVYKQWKDDDDAEGLRPDDVTITLTGTYTEDGVTEECGEPQTATITEADNWTAVFAEIPVYHEGCAIDYTVDEVALDGYESVITGNAEDGFTVTNTLTGEIDAIEVNKIWDEEDAYGNIPASVEVALFANGDPAIHTDGNAVEAITLTPDDWSGEFTDLPKYDENGAKIDYTVEEMTEESLRFFTPEYTWNTDESVTITNYQKYFDLDEEIVPDEDDRTGWETQESVNAYNAIEIEMSTMLPDMSGEEMAAGEYSIVFHDELMSELVLDESAADFKLTIGGETVDSRYYTITLADGTSPARLTPFSITINDDCAFHVEVDLTSLYNDGVITDDDLTGDTEIMLYFFADLEGTDLNGSYTSTAWYEVYDGDEVQYTSDQHVVTVTTYEIEITKYDATDNAPLAGATLGVYYDEECASPVIRNGEPYTAVSDEEGTAVYYGLAEGIYYIQETEAPIGYQLSEEVLKVDLTALDGYKFLGEYANEPLAPVEVTGTKTWDDKDNQDGKRPASVTVNLLANGEPALDDTGNAITATVTAYDKIDDNTWSYSFNGLPQVTEDGTAITYTVTEDAVEGYDTSIDGYDITNTHEPETIAIAGEKFWDDNDNQDGVRPDFITIHLLADGDEIAKQTITEEDVQRFDFGTQPKYADGKEIEYTVSETVPSSLPDGTYTVSYGKDETDDAIAFTVTNTHIPATTEIKGTKVWEDGGDQDGARPEEITVCLYATGANSTSVFKTTTDETKDWDWSFGEDLPVYDSGVAIEYTVLEEAVSDYNATYDYDMEEEGVIDVTITNTHTPGETSLTVVKYWNDEDDAAGFRPESITVNLLQDGQKYDSAELSEDNDWEYTFTNLPEKHHDAGEDVASYTYTVEEVSVDHYVTTGPERLGGTNAYSITNSYTPEETEVTVDKKWEDGDDQDGIRPASVKVSLLANDDVVKEATLDDSNNWAHTFAELPVYVDGKEMTYTVEETDVPAGYTSAMEESEDADGYPVYTITNTHEPETIDISGTKVWLDNDNQDGKRPTDITINLLADGVQVDSKDFRDPDVHPARLVTPLIKILRDSAEETEDWTWSFEGLPKYANGVEIVYTVEEEPVDGYESYIQGDMTTGFQIFNTHTPEQIDISVVKDWDDANDQDGLRPAYITVQLLNDGTVVDDRIIVADADGDWGCTFTADKYADGDEIAYEVKEILPESVAEGAYEEPVIEGSATDGFTITNTHEPKTISIKIAKEWDDEGDQDGKRPDEITVGIFAGATWVDDATLTEDSNWAPVTFEGLPAYADGEKIQYMIYESEENLDGYTADAEITTDGETGDVSCTITNTYTPEETGVMVTKVWDDGEDQDGKRPASVTVNLLANDEPALDDNEEPITAELNEENGWSYNFTGLPDYEHGDEIVYTVTEDAVADYDTVIIPIENANEFILVNSYTPETIDVAVDKTWDDGEDQDGKRPAFITYRLLADGVEVADWNAIAEEDWAHTFADVARYADGKEIDYTVTEDDVAEYTTTIDSSKDNSTGDYTVSVTNTYEPESTDMHVVKVWDDSDDQDGLRPTSVTVNLLADDTVVETAELSDESDIDEDGNWTCTFDDLPVYADGGEITYTVTEDAVDGYECTKEESTDEDGHLICTITNTHEPETIAIAGEKFWDDEDNQDGVRPDYIIMHLLADGDEVDSKTITDSDVESDDDWTFDFGDLPVYADGNEITYTLTETLPASADGLYEEPVITPEETDDGIYFTVTNTHTPATVTIKGTKVWDDGEDQDGERLEYVPILLLADGQVVATTTADKEDAVDDDTWNWSFGEMPVYDDGTPIQYYVVEGEVTDYTPTYEYDMDVEGVFDVTITNTHTPDTTSLTVIKYWNDKDDESGFRPESIEIELLQDAAEYDTVELNEDNNWTYTFTDLPKKHDSGVEYTYSVEELTAISDVYTPTGPTLVEGSESTYVFTNTYEPEETEVVVDKKWNDDNDRDRYRPESITATLLVNGTFDKEATLDEANNWAYTFGELPVYVNGEEATYTVEEVAVPNYDTETEYEETTNVDGLDITKVTITNTYVPETVELHGTKIWVDNDNQDSVRPDEVTVNILADGEPALDENGDPITVTLSAPKADEEGGNGGANFLRVLSTPLIRTLADDDETVENRWEWSIELPKYDGWEDDGVTRHEVVYTLDEVEVEGYESDIEGDMWSSFEIFNIHTPDTIDITGEKVWVDDNNSEGLRPAYITINLYEDDATEATASQTITAENEWNFAFTDLPTHENGEEINYTLTESMPTDAEYPYVSSGFEEVEEGSNVYTVTNTLSDETSITVDVDWDDGDNASETRPEDGIEVTLYANGDEVETVTLTGEDWTYTWDEMPVYDENGARITYTIEYGDIEGYDTETTYDEETDTFTIESTLIHSVDIYKYTGSGDGNWATIKEVVEDPNNDPDQAHESYYFEDMEPGTYYVAYHISSNETVRYLANGEMRASNDVDDEEGEYADNVYVLTQSPTFASYASGAQTITVTEAGTYFIHEKASLINYGYTFYLIPTDVAPNSGNDLSVNTPGLIQTTGTCNFEVLDATPLAGAQFVLTNDAGEYGVFEDGAFVEWTEDEDDATILTSAEDGYIHLTGLAAGSYSLIEVEAPYTYAPLEEPVEVTIGAADVTVDVDVENEPATTDVHINKEWDDNDDQDGMRTASVAVNLVKGEDADAEVVDTAELSDANDWAYTFEGIPAYEDGEEIDYTVEEAEVPEGYDCAIAEDTDEDGHLVYTLTNTHEPETIDIVIAKVWDDNDNQDGKRPDSLTVGLFADATWLGDAVLEPDGGGNWSTYTFEDLPVYANGVEIRYTAYEEDEELEGYTPDAEITTDGETVTCTITNSYTPGETSVTVTKVWEDEDNQDGHRPDSVTVNLMEGEEPVLDPETEEPITATLSEDNEWTDSFTGLPEYENGEKIEYTVTEDSVENYDTEIIPIENSNEFIIVNSHTPETIEITGEKIWDDANDQDGVRPDYIDVDLMADGVVVDSLTVTDKAAVEGTDEDDTWAFEFGEQPKYNGIDASTGEVHEIVYTVAETMASSVEEGTYDTTIGAPVETDDGICFEITNTHTPETFTINGAKVWEDENDQDGARPTSVTLNLLADGEPALDESGAPIVVTVTDEIATDYNTWAWSIENLPVYKDGMEIQYHIVENEVTGYTVASDYEIEDTDVYDVTITNTHTPDETYVSVIKIWDDENDQDGKRPAELTIELLRADSADAEPEVVAETTLTLSEANNWSGTFENLPVKHHEAGEDAEEYVYSVQEVLNEELGYTSDGPQLVEGTTTYTITNTYEPETTDFTVTKIWDDADDQDGCRPDSITVSLLANGAATDYMAQLSASDDTDENWTYTFTDLPVYANGEAIDYTVTETMPEDVKAGTYETEIKYNTETVGDDVVINIGATITNTHEPETVTLYGTKIWVDNNDQDGYRPDEITVNILADGEPALDENGDPVTVTVSAPEEDGGNGASSPIRLLLTPLIQTLADDDETVESRWAWSISNLPKYGFDEDGNGGMEIKYTVSESMTLDENVPEDAYSTSITGDAESGFEIFNIHETEQITITGEKIWDDEDDRDGVRPKYITINLSADGDAIDSQTITADDIDENTGNWLFEFKNLDKYADGEEIEYTVTETMPGAAVEAYEMTLTSEKDADGNIAFTVTNTHTPETVDVEGSKTWDDNDNQDNKRPASITIHLLADGEAALDEESNPISATVTADDGWSWSFIDLPKYQDGVEITYTIAEDEVEGYETTVNGYDVTNTYEPGKTSLNVQKIWDDEDDQDGIRPEFITVTLVKNDNPTEQTLTLDESNGWAGTFTDLDEYTSGIENTYSIAELDEVDGYTTTVDSVDETSTIVIKNEHTPATIDIPVTKVWDDSDNQDGSRPENITFRVWNGNTMVDSETIEVNEESETQSYTFEELAKYEGGKEIEYVVTEDSVDNYSTEVTESTEDGFTVTNSHTPEQTSISVFKVWDDNGDQYGLRPREITVELLADGVETGETLTLNEGNNWMGRFTVDKYEDGGTEIAYTVAEDQVDGYCEPVITGDASIGYIITNTLDTVRLHGTVIWVDDSDAYDVRPDEVTLDVYADDELALDDNENPITVTVNATTTFSLLRPLIKTLAADKNEWQWSSGNLPKYNEDGTEIEYTVEEEKFDNSEKYDTYVEGDAENGFEVFNVYSETNKITLTLVDSTDYDITLPNTGLFTLYKVVEDGDDVRVEGQVDLTTDENGQIIIEGLEAGSYYFVQTDIDNEDYSLPSNTKSKTFTIPDDQDENGEYAVAMEDDPVYVVNYAVKIWGIGADTYSYDDGDTTQTAGLTFGPATGGDYLTDYVSRETVIEAGGEHDSEYCIHDMYWTDIVEQSKTNPGVFEDCMKNGCTKAVKLTPNSTLFNTDTAVPNVVSNAKAHNYIGDGVGTLHYELNYNNTNGSTTYACRWNYATGTSTVDDAYTYPNVYSRSRIRTMLTGDSTNIMDAVNNHNSPSGIYYTSSSPLADSSNCLLSCFPKALQDAVVPRATSNQGTGAYVANNHPAEDIETYDKLWLFSLTELGLSANYDDSGGIDYEMASSNNARIAYGISSATAGATSAQVWWTRSRYTFSNPTISYAVSNTGDVNSSNSVTNACGISPCFCLPGPDEEEGYTGTVKYAVKLWGICTDTYSEDGGDTTGTASLTFGPALGADYINSSETCGSDTCINKLEWDEIIELCEENQGDKAALNELFGSCLENGCTKAVELETNSTLFNTETVQNVMAQSYSGDGVSTLSNLLNTEDGTHSGLFWNLTTTGATSNNDPANIYSRSRVRTSLTGDSANIEQQVHSGHINYYYSDAHPLLNENNCLFSCFPENLQEAIVPRKVTASDNSNDVDTYDTLWLMSLSELGIEDAADNGKDYGIATEDADRVAYEFSDTDALTVEASTWWTRTRSDSYYFRVNEIAADGSNNQEYRGDEVHDLIGADSGHGISPAFCLK